MFSNYDECECTLDYSDEGITGKATKMEHKGKGIFYCPACKKNTDYSESTYNIRVKFYEEDGYTLAKIIEPFDKRLMKPVEDCYPDRLNIERLNKDCLEEDLHEGCWLVDETYVSKHKPGIFDIVIYWEWGSYSTECGDEWDLEMFIIEEKGVHAVVQKW